MSRRLLYVALAEAGVLATATNFGCGPQISASEEGTTTTVVADSSESGRTTEVTTVDSSGDVPGSSGGSTGSSSSGADTSTGVSSDWGEPQELVELTDDGEDLVVFSLLVAGDYIHVGGLSPNFYTRHWVIHRDTGDVSAVSPIGGLLARSDAFVYATGLRYGGDGSPDAEWALNRMTYGGAEDTELLVSGEAMYVRAAHPGGAFVERTVDGNRELWRVDDTGEPVALGLLDEIDLSLAIFDEERLIGFDASAMALAAIDVETLMATPIAQLVDYPVALAANSLGLYVAGFESVVRLEKPDYVVELLESGAAVDVAADDVHVVWTSSVGAGASRILASDAGAQDPVVVWEDDQAVSHVALDASALYFVRETSNVGAIVRVERP